MNAAPVLQRLTGAPAAARWLQQHISGTLRSDSRQVCAGDGFLAWPGAATDARRYVGQVLAAGAGACLIEAEGAEAWDFKDARVATYAGLKRDAAPIAAAYFGQPSERLAVLAVTGTNGKTSTAWWLAQALGALPGAQAQPCAVLGTLGVGQPPHAGASADGAAAHPLAALRATGTIVEVDHPTRGKYLTVGNPIKMSDSATDVTRSPLLGEHTNQVLEQLGYSAEDIAQLRVEKVI